MPRSKTSKISQQINRRGYVFVISAPSGVGKSTLIRQLTLADPTLKFSISVTTRAKRKGEKEGIDYHFKTKEEFYKLIEEGAFLEYAEVYGNLYGTLRKEVLGKINSGEDIIMDVDLQGASLIKEQIPEDAITIYVLPPSMEELERRIRKRNKDSEDSIRYRIAKSVNELRSCPRYNYLVINDTLPVAVGHIQEIISAHRNSISRMTNLEEVVNGILSGNNATLPTASSD